MVRNLLSNPKPNASLRALQRQWLVENSGPRTYRVLEGLHDLLIRQRDSRVVVCLVLRVLFAVQS